MKHSPRGDAQREKPNYCYFNGTVLEQSSRGIARKETQIPVIGMG
jgi:hypothetical protein